MNLFNLNSMELGVVTALSLVAIACMVSTFLVQYNELKCKHATIISFVLLIVTILNESALIEINKVVNIDDITYISGISSFVANLGSYVQYLFVVGVVGYTISSFFILKHNINSKITGHSINDALENIPIGLMFADNRGYIYFENRVMRELNAEILEDKSYNAIELYERLRVSSRNVTEDIEEVNHLNPIFDLSDDSVWSFSRSDLIVDGVKYIKIQADDITTTYRLSDDIRIANERLKSEQNQLIEQMKNIDTYIAEEETLRVKMMVHDDFGELIALTARASMKDMKNSDKRKLIYKWERLCDKMSRFLTFDTQQEYTLQSVKYLAKQLNVKVDIIGKIPNDAQISGIIFRAINESIKNVVSHAKEDRIKVVILEKDDCFDIKITNKDKNEFKKVVLGGGLSSLYELIEKYGGSMEFECGYEVKLTIKLNKK